MQICKPVWREYAGKKRKIYGFLYQKRIMMKWQAKVKNNGQMKIEKQKNIIRLPGANLSNRE